MKKALQLSREEHKPLMIDFTGWACVNCRKMEENVWTQPKVHDYIKNNFILVSLYVDDRGVLPVNERFTYSTKTGDQKDIHTIGDKWATFQAENFSQVTQPLYALLNNNEALLNHPVGYTPDADAYLAWLQCAKTPLITATNNQYFGPGLVHAPSIRCVAHLDVRYMAEQSDAL